MAAYLIENPPVRSQWFQKRNRPLTGATILHSSESIMDSVGPDTGAESVAKYIQGRTTPGSYHDLVDSDTGIYLVPYEHGAFHDGTGSNNWALSLSFALRTVDWARMTAQKRAAFLQQGALRFVAQQQWRKQVGAPLTRLRYITKTESDAGQSGFCCHGWRDPARRSDPGTRADAPFPFDEWLTACRVALTQHMPDHPDAGGDDMPTPQEIATAVWTHELAQRSGIGPAGAGDWLTHAAVTSTAATQELAVLRATVAVLAERKDLSVEEIKGLVTDLLKDQVVQVDVDVRGGKTAPSA